MLTRCTALQETDAGVVILGALNETRRRPPEEQVTLFVPTNAAFAIAGSDFYNGGTYYSYDLYTDYEIDVPFGPPVDVRPNPPIPPLVPPPHPRSSPLVHPRGFMTHACHHHLMLYLDRHLLASAIHCMPQLNARCIDRSGKSVQSSIVAA